MATARLESLVTADAELAARLHAAAAGLAVGMAVLKDESQRTGNGRAAIDMLNEVAHQLRQLSRSHRARTPGRRGPRLDDELRGAAKSARVDLDLDVRGSQAWLGADHASLLLLVGREAIRNVKRHSGVASCRITLDLSDCPFVMKVRDWRAGLPAAGHAGDGVVLLGQLARTMGCRLAVRSLPGLGTELVLTGPACPRNRESQTRSVVAEESPGSRGRVGARRPIKGRSEQITQV